TLTRLMTCAALLATAAAATAQTYPSKPIRFVVGFSAGGSTDLLARLLADEMRKDWNATVVVENRVGAGGVIAADHVAKSPPDGYTLFVQSATHTAIGALRKQLPYHSVDSFTPITLVATAPNVLLVRPDSPYKTLDSFIAAAKAKPGEITYATSAVGGALHLAGEQFAHLAGIRLNHVPYKGANEVTLAVMSGTVESSWNAANAAMAHVNAGKLHILGVASEKRFALLPNAPTFAELGIKSMTSETWVGVLGPAGLPADVTSKLNDYFQNLVKRPDVTEKLHKLGAVPVGTGPAEFRKLIADEIATLSDIAKKAKIEID
ncbi:MAG TPA: tripartite tricarboxylate transporter substrate binding protein, partial [Burkholderiaceae bacterium]|nr:tripartite tricarboxylate transporter substrate binding protein [Burkholderiaceae bacterium]